MALPILATKLFVPPRPRNAISRARLTERLDHGLGADQRLVLVAAPAGFGKTTLVTEWVANHRIPAAWLSLDEHDSDPVRFLRYLIQALRTILPELLQDLQEALDSPQPPPIEAVFISLVNELSIVRDDFALVLDDLHVIDSRAIDQSLEALVENMPPAMHLVVTTREDPSLPLARLRARGQLVEVRAADLRFTTPEAAEFLNRRMALDLSAQDVEVLENRTEGWIAGLQLAALSMQNRADVPGFIRDFEGDHRYVLDYLVEEVLQNLPAAMRDFLIRTSILDRLNGPLCEAVTGQRDGLVRLETLQRGNFFLIPLDDRGEWYRYHHLFADVLRVTLAAESPELKAELHLRASEWFENHGAAAEAVRHALAAEDYPRAAALIERAVPTLRANRQEVKILEWLDVLPDGLFTDRPILSVYHASALLLAGRMEGVAARLALAEDRLENLAGGGPPVIADPKALELVPTWISTYRAAMALIRGELEDSERFARQALERITGDDHLSRGAPAGILALVVWRRGDLEGAFSYYDLCREELELAGHFSDALGCSIALADIRITQGRLRDALRIFRRGLALSEEKGAHLLRGTADMHVGICEILLAQNDLAGAREHLTLGAELGEPLGLPQFPYRWRAAEASIYEAAGDLEAALVSLEAAERVFSADFFPDVRPLAARKARIRVKLGRLAAAADWAQAAGLDPEDSPVYMDEYAHICLAGLLLARFRQEGRGEALNEAMALLTRLQEAAAAGGRHGSRVEILALLSLGHRLQGDGSTAQDCLGEALALAAPQGWVRIFVDQGAEIAALIREGAGRGVLPEFARTVLAAFEDTGQSEQPASTGTAPGLIEPLSPRELDVLRLFNTELSGPEIAAELVVALSTVRTHTKGIYGKLNVNSRRAAVKKAIELGLI